MEVPSKQGVIFCGTPCIYSELWILTIHFGKRTCLTWSYHGRMLLCLFISCNIFQNRHLFSCYQKNDTIQIRSNKTIWLFSNEKCLSLSHNIEETKQSNQVYWIYLFLNFAPGEKSFANVSSRRLFRSVYWHTRVFRMSTSVSSI